MSNINVARVCDRVDRVCDRVANLCDFVDRVCDHVDRHKHKEKDFNQNPTTKLPFN